MTEIPRWMKDLQSNDGDAIVHLVAQLKIVEQYPRIPAIYFLMRAGVVVYVGQSVDVVSRVHTHEVERTKRFDEIRFLPMSEEDLNLSEKFFINYFRPEYNRSKYPNGGRGRKNTRMELNSPRRGKSAKRN